jgi:MarC family membrane protein
MATTYTFVSALVSLFLILDPLGNIPLFASMLKNLSPQRRRYVIVREHIIAFSTLLVFMFIGQPFLNAMGLSNTSLQISGGVVLFLIAIKMIFPQKDDLLQTTQEEPLIVPLAIPSIAGPSALATVMLLVSQQPGGTVKWVLALVVASVLSLAILLIADRLQELVDKRFIVAMEKLMGLILITMGIEMLVQGIRSIFL